ncbi:hypothetical protein [Oryza sativa Japonica Group]|uniref:Uncharacterized protein n=1 Tax=Oryza sativa subsp. japonica TaxID=39947 RepID=Q5ZCZ8_ORYSJ|nr:hypothetical protein [Oryza sativa Japonica Group]
MDRRRGRWDLALAPSAVAVVAAWGEALLLPRHRHCRLVARRYRRLVWAHRHLRPDNQNKQQRTSGPTAPSSQALNWGISQDST